MVIFYFRENLTLYIFFYIFTNSNMVIYCTKMKHAVNWFDLSIIRRKKRFQIPDIEFQTYTQIVLFK